MDLFDISSLLRAFGFGVWDNGWQIGDGRAFQHKS
jgi:hypothetical protein